MNKCVNQILKKNTKKKSQEESHGDDWFCDPIKKAMNDFNSGKHQCL